MPQENNKRIAKNTLFLYVRMLLVMVVTLYTSRIILDKLGVTDYGIYNVVGGIVSMLSFLSNSMSNAVQRYLSYEIGKGNGANVNKVFVVALQAHIVIAIFVASIMEVVGVWYLNNYMNIPSDRLVAANWVLQCSIFTTFFSIIQVPFTGMIISKEDMQVYAYISIIEVVLKLGVVYLIVETSMDRLVLFSILMSVASVGVMLMYQGYCIKHYAETKLRWVKDLSLLKQLVGFASWNMLGEISWAFTGQGVNFLLNAYYCPAVNAARGLAMQVNSAVNKFVANFQTAVNPQIVKTYASNELDETKSLLYRSTRFSFFLLLALSLPFLIEMEFVLNLWLVEVPHYAVNFCRLMMISSLVGCVSNLMAQIARAYGKIRKYQIIVSCCLFLNFPLSWIALHLGASPLITAVVSISVQLLLILVRIRLTKSMIGMRTRDFVKEVLVPILKVTAYSIFVALAIKCLTVNPWVDFIKNTSFSLLGVCVVSYLVGMKMGEKQYIKVAFINTIHRLRR